MYIQSKILEICCIFAILIITPTLAKSVAEPKFMTSLYNFSQNIFDEIVKTNNNRNIIISPFSIQTCLAVAFMGADGETASEMQHALGFTAQTSESVANNFHSILSKYENGETMRIINKLYVKQGYEFQENYNKTLSGKFFSYSEDIEFAQTQEAAKNINTWIEMKTDKKIQNIISPSLLNSETRLLLVSSIYFKGNWKTSFDEQDTKEREFFVDATNAVNVQMMYANSDFDIAKLEELESFALRLPYKDSNLSMIIILPSARNGLSAVEAKLKNFPLESLQERLKNVEVEVYLPKFKAEFEIELSETLKTMGMMKMFANADFGKMLRTSDPLHISSIVHKAFIEVTELGTEAGAVTELSLTPLCLPYTFNADHPFYYAIVDEDFVPLFQGTVVGF